MKKETQTQRVAKRLIKFGYITTSEAMSEMYITRLAARIGELKDRCIIAIDRELIKWGDSKQAKYSINSDSKMVLRYALKRGEV